MPICTVAPSNLNDSYREELSGGALICHDLPPPSLPFHMVQGVSLLDISISPSVHSLLSLPDRLVGR